jgi:hypothetical protein
VRMDAGNDDVQNLRRLRKKPQVDWIIKRNLRQKSEADWLEEAQCHSNCETPRVGKDIWTDETWKERDSELYRVIFRVTERTITADGQRLLGPEIEMAKWWTSLKLPPKVVIELYHQHGTSEQFHSELKSDMDLERLPSGKFSTNALMLSALGRRPRPWRRKTVGVLANRIGRRSWRSWSKVFRRSGSTRTW